MAISIARERGMFIVLDADGLYLVGKDTSIIKGYRRAVLTPNVVEFKRLSEQVGVDPNTPTNLRASEVSRKLGGVTVLQKGAKDVISTDSTGEEADLAASQLKGANPQSEQAKETVEIDVPGGMKRCGGQGDVLSGAVGTFMAWGKCYEDGAFGCVLKFHECYQGRLVSVIVIQGQKAACFKDPITRVYWREYFDAYGQPYCICGKREKCHHRRHDPEAWTGICRSVC